MKLYSTVCFFLLSATLTMAAEVGTSEKEHEAEKAALAWLSYVDDGDYAKSWEQAGQLLQQQVTLQEWQRAVTNARHPLGELKSRDSQVAQYVTSLPGAPDGEYVVLQFNSAFDNKAAAAETATVAFEDNIWRVVGYFVR